MSDKNLKLSWYALEKKIDADGSLDVFILDEIGMWGVSASDFIKDINASLESGKELRVHISSPGGDVFDGLAIFNFLDRMSNVTTIVEGLAASIASIIAMAGTNIIMPENALMMIHNPWSFTAGDSDELRQAADALEKFEGSLAGIYAKKTGKDVAEIRDMMDAETWMTGVEAVEMGFATMTTDAVKIAASFDVAKLKNLPASAAKMLEETENKMDDIAKLQGELATATAALSTLEGGAEGRRKDAFDGGVEAGKDETLGLIKARMEQYKDASFVMETLELADGEVKDKHIAKLEADKKELSDKVTVAESALAAAADDGGAAIEIAGADALTQAAKDTDEAYNARRGELKSEGKSAEDAVRQARKEFGRG